jgi:hypothetical protein
VTLDRILVTLIGLAAIVWVLWYFLAPLGRSRPSRGSGVR